MSYILKLVLKNGERHAVINEDPDKLKDYAKIYKPKEISIANVYHQAGAFVGFMIDGKIVNYKLEEVL